MSSPARLGDLTASEWERLEDVLDRFERAWKQSDVVEMRAFLPPVGDRLRPFVLRELVKTEMEIRWRRGRRALVESFLERFPELRQDPAELARLLLEEYRVRHRYGDRPEVDGYRTRFPQEYVTFQQLARGEEAPPPSETPVDTPSDPPATLRPMGKAPVPRPTPPPQAPPTPPVPEAPVVPSIGGGYRLIKRLGAGTFGEVWRAEAPGGIAVAVKIIHRPIDHAEAQRELQALQVIKGLRHPFVLTVQAFWSSQERLIIAMELADGSLRDELKKVVAGGQTGLTRKDLLGFMHEACEALDYLHAQRVLHRDIKPDNVLLVQRHVKLADLGLARLLEGQRTFTATMCGSPPYMAPEVWGGRAGPASDQYSLAVMYVELRVNRYPFPGSSPAELMFAHVEREPELVGMPDAEQRVLKKALAKRPEERFDSCLAFVRALASALTEADPGDEPGVRRKPAVRPRRRGPRIGRWVAAAVAVLMLLGLGVGVYYWAQVRPQPTDTGPTIDPPLKVTHIPINYRPTAEAKPVPLPGGRVVYNRIELDRPGLPAFEYVLIMPNVEKGLSPYYLSRTKMTNLVYKAIVDQMPQKPADEEWKKGAIAVDGKGADLGILGHMEYPVFRVRVDDAEKAARFLGGRLPSVLEWDHAAGLYTAGGAVGPFNGRPEGWGANDFGLKRIDANGQPSGGARPVATARLDRALSGCADMAANGYEWTATVLVDKVAEPLDLDNKDQQGEVILRGMLYLGVDPLVFSQLKVPPDTTPRQVPDDLRLLDTSFRVLLDIK